MRVSGMVSGMDTDSIVSDLMKVERTKVDRYNQKKQVGLWKQEDYRNVNKNIANFILNSQKNMGLKKKGNTGVMINQSYKNLDYMRIAASSNKDVADVKVKSSASNGTFDIDVKQIAKSSYYTVENLKNLDEKHTGNIRIAGVEIYNGEDDADGGISTKDLIKEINSNKELKAMNVSAFYDTRSKSLFIQGDAGLDLSIVNYKPEFNVIDMEIEFDDKGKLKENVEIEIEGKKITLEKNSTAEDIKEAIKKENINYKTEIETKEGKTTLKVTNAKMEKNTLGSLDEISSLAFDIDGNLNAETKIKIKGSDKEIAISGNKEDIIKTLSEEGYSARFDGDKLIVDGKGSKGQKAIVEINGVTIEDGSNKIDFNGLEIAIKTEGVSTINVETNYDEIINKITGIVDEYNTLVDDISKMLNQKKYSGYHPLSNDEKAAMKDNDVKLWEEKSKSGMLNNDETLKKMLSNARFDLYKDVVGLEGSFNNITQIGITTQKYAKGTTGGKLQVNEDKLREALEKDTDGVMELMFGSMSSSNKKTTIKDSEGDVIYGEGKDGKFEIKDKNKYTTNGIFTGIYDNLINGMKDVISKSGPGEDSELLRDVRSNILIDFVSNKGSISDIDRDVMSLERKIADLDVMLNTKEESYYKQFTRMEKYMQKMFSQSNWLAQQTMM